jgi:hypothetical protein
MEPAERSTREMDREAKEPSLCSTLRRWDRSGLTQAGTLLLALLGMLDDGVMIGFAEEIGSVFLPTEGTGEALMMAAGDIAKVVFRVAPRK